VANDLIIKVIKINKIKGKKNLRFSLKKDLEEKPRSVKASDGSNGPQLLTKTWRIKILDPSAT